MLRQSVVILTLCSCATVTRPVSRALDVRASPVRTIDPHDTDFDDLAGFDRFVGDARVVMLGESHGDGSSQLAMTRLVAFLHQRKGFDVVAFEAGLLDALEVDERLSRGASIPSAVEAIPTPWSQSAQSRPLFEYVAASKKSNAPIVVTGFDCIARDQDSSLRRLRQLLEAEKITLSDSDNACLANVIGYRFGECADALLASLVAQSHDELAKQFLLGLTAAQQMLRLTKDAPDPKTNREGYIAFMQRVSPQLGARDQAMGETMQWLIDRRFAGKKVIFWGARGHLSMGLIEGSPSAGRPVLQALGEAGRNVSFTWYDGSFGTPWTAIEEQTPAGADSLETQLHATNHPYWFVDLRGATDPLLVDHEVVQGEFFISHMEPVSYAKDATRP